MKNRIKTAFILLLFFLPAAFLQAEETRAKGKFTVNSHAGKKVDFICKTTLQELKDVLKNLNYTDILKRIQQQQKTIIIDRTHAIEIVKKIKINRLQYFTNNTNIQKCSLSIDHGRGTVTINGLDPLADVCIQSDDKNCAISATDGSYVINVNSPGPIRLPIINAAIKLRRNNITFLDLRRWTRHPQLFPRSPIIVEKFAG